MYNNVNRYKATGTVKDKPRSGRPKSATTEEIENLSKENLPPPSQNIEGVVKKSKSIWLRAHLFEAAVLPALRYASKAWTLRKQYEHAVSVTQRALERTMLAILPRRCRRESGVPSCVIERRSGSVFVTLLNRRSGGPDTLCYIVLTSGTGRLLTRIIRDIKRTPGRPPTR
uniref:Uncharacterized protein n=1 Tax=Haemonchus contortus TaxID=6289 RepID=A0A7I4YSP1_HAECO